MSTIADMIADIQRMAEAVAQSAPAVAKDLERAVQGQIRAGRTPEGETWQQTAEGEQPLQHAAKALTVVGAGKTLILRLRGPEARHSKGTARGRIKRQILPEKGLPASYARVIRASLDRAIKER